MDAFCNDSQRIEAIAQNVSAERTSACPPGNNASGCGQGSRISDQRTKRDSFLGINRLEVRSGEDEAPCSGREAGRHAVCSASATSGTLVPFMQSF